MKVWLSKRVVHYSACLSYIHSFHLIFPSFPFPLSWSPSPFFTFRLSAPINFYHVGIPIWCAVFCVCVLFFLAVHSTTFTITSATVTVNPNRVAHTVDLLTNWQLIANLSTAVVVVVMFAKTPTTSSGRGSWRNLCIMGILATSNAHVRHRLNNNHVHATTTTMHE